MVVSPAHLTLEVGNGSALCVDQAGDCFFDVACGRSRLRYFAACRLVLIVVYDIAVIIFGGLDAIKLRLKRFVKLLRAMLLDEEGDSANFVI